MNDLLRQSSEIVAPALLGWRLVRTLEGKQLAGMIVETEAYDQADAASHSYKGMTARTRVMFGEPGHAYVYFTYGMHYCVNVVTGRKGRGSGVLIRALEPLEGIESMRQFRKIDNVGSLTNGPAKLCQALAIDKAFNGHKLSEPPLQLMPPLDNRSLNIKSSTRIGISRDTHRLWRFYVKGNAYVSHPKH